MHWTEAYGERDGKLYRNDRLAEQVAKQPLHFDRGFKPQSVALQVASVAFCFAVLAVSCGLWYLVVCGVGLLMR
jgi:hypothetical protein